jgi:hypothetical protein
VPIELKQVSNRINGSVADRVPAKTGWQHSQGRIRLVAPRRMRRMVARHGFIDVRVGAMSHGRVVRAPRADFARFYAIVGRRAG